MGATRTRSVMCSTVCRWTRACGRGSTKASGRLPPGSSSYRLKSTGWGGGVARNLAVYFALLLPGPGCPLSPWGGMVQHFSQGHRDGHPLMPQHGAEPSLSPPLRGARDVFAINNMRPHEGTTCGLHTKETPG